MTYRAKHQPCACGCGELADECMTGRSNPLAAFTITATCSACQGWGSIETSKRITGEAGRVARTCRTCNGSGRVSS